MSLGVMLMWLVFAFVVAGVAQSRGRSTGGFFLLSLLLSPIVAAVVLAMVRNLAQEKREEERKRDDHVRHLEELARAPKAQVAVASVADELRKLAELRDSGLLSEDEFDRQRRRLLQ